MNLRTKIILYLVLLHVVLGGVAFFVLSENRKWLLIVEALFLISIAVGWMLVRAFFVPLNLIRTGADLMAEREFTTRFREVGQPEMDALVRVYNEMIDRLREERLRVEEHQQLLAKIAEASPEGVIICDLEGRISSMNPAAKRLLRDAGVEGQTPLPAALRAATLTPEGRGKKERVPNVPPGESEIVSLPGGRKIRIHHGEFFDRGFSRSFYLIDELTEEVRASEKAAYEQLIRMVSHEVNNSVGAVRSLLESSLHYSGQVGDQDRDDFTNALKVAINRMDHLNAFVNGFADVVRLPPPNLSECRVDDLMKDILTLIRPELESRQIEARIRVEGEVQPVMADKNQLEQALLNVMKNAIEAIGSKGSIDIEFARNGKRQSLRIADSGHGIAPEIASRLFSPFFSTKRDGRGLGLTLIQEVLKQHRFDYSLENRAEGGAEFRVTF